ncbi:hypothetical protein QVD17_38487 [Tagetes erecta]|uniref:Uncharacterized protein n=1 Tax=Tagetes erecta TaxID=13708 RepID=A0AAD8NGA6_TARER|nr:hypothetical protein QVD17_38487 [Tagetes erecta]
MIVRGRMNERVICVKSFLREKIVLKEWVKMPKKPTSFMSSSARSMAVFEVWLIVANEDEGEDVVRCEMWMNLDGVYNVEGIEVVITICL